LASRGFNFREAQIGVRRAKVACSLVLEKRDRPIRNEKTIDYELTEQKFFETTRNMNTIGRAGRTREEIEINRLEKVAWDRGVGSILENSSMLTSLYRDKGLRRPYEDGARRILKH